MGNSSRVLGSGNCWEGFKTRYRVPAFIVHIREMFGPYLPKVGNEAMGGAHLALNVRNMNRH